MSANEKARVGARAGGSSKHTKTTATPSVPEYRRGNQSADDGAELRFTIWHNFETDGTFKSCTWPEFITFLREVKTKSKKEALPLLRLAQFKANSRARGASVVRIYGIEGDYDAGKVSPAKTAALLKAAGVRAVVVTTPRHTDAAPRWRVFAPLSKPHAPTARRDLLARLNGVLRGVLADESFRPLLSYFVGPVRGKPYEFYETKGDCLDTLQELDADAVYPATGIDSDNPLPKDVKSIPTLWQDLDPVDVRRALKVLGPNMGYFEWINVGMTLHSADPDETGPAFDAWHRWSQRGEEKYESENDLLHHWRSFTQQGGTTISTLYWMAGNAQREAARRNAIDLVRNWKPPGRDAICNVIPVKFAVESWIQCGHVGLMPSEGGTGKTIALLWLGIAHALGVPWLGLKVLKGTFALLSRDDSQEDLDGALARLLTENLFKPAQIDMVRQRCRVISLRGLEAAQLVTSTDTGRNHVVSDFAADLVKALGEINDLVHVAIDTARQFSGADSSNEVAGIKLMSAAAQIAELPTKPAVTITHHIGKVVARNKIEDMYAAIGTSALSDNARYVLQLRKLDAPEIARSVVLPDNTVLGVADTLLKLESMRGSLLVKAPPAPLFYMRRGFTLTPVQASRLSREEQTEMRAADLAASLLKIFRKAGKPIGRDAAREEGWKGRNNEWRVAKTAATEALEAEVIDA